MSDENRGVAKKRTMVKDRVGCVRSTTRSLPEQSHTYGMKSPPDPEGAGEGQTRSLLFSRLTNDSDLKLDYR
jgi:hypothetical protein